MKKTLLILIFGMFLVSLVSAEECEFDKGCIGTFAENSDVELYQVCNNCTYCNFTSVKNPDGLNILTNIQSTQDGTFYSFNLSGGNTTDFGEYIYCYDCGNNVENVVGCLEFVINPTGEEFSLTNGFMLIGQFTMIALFMALGLTFSRTRWKLRSFFFMMATGMGVILLNSTRIIAGQSGTLNTMGNIGLYIGIIVLLFMTGILLVFFTIDVIDSIKQKKERKWV